MIIGGFDWDEGNWPKCGKHGLSKEQVESVFAGEFAAYDDPYTATEETRLRAIGKTLENRYIFVVFCLRTRNSVTLVRPISARYMHLEEVRQYEQK